jgi:hypothetical protein
VRTRDFGRRPENEAESAMGRGARKKTQRRARAGPQQGGRPTSTAGPRTSSAAAATMEAPCAATETPRDMTLGQEGPAAQEHELAGQGGSSLSLPSVSGLIVVLMKRVVNVTRVLTKNIVPDDGDLH